MGLGRIWNTTSMDERCEVVKKLGGTYYADPLLCPDLHLLEDDDTVNDGYRPGISRKLTEATIPHVLLGD
ncbi:hypothetical protein F5Y03DRAFT_356384 [Xylaria venustula]|nr:hypothetical protein F5Y03DRAFT_356384 [Xylaria venustula]